ncbi:MAG: glycine betaine/L-proline ABC transporter substrate-binding protein ProX [bacterium]|nr:glycine betaine/L-proline ABC transporter substrate-binding protein ProX [bacterium]
MSLEPARRRAARSHHPRPAGRLSGRTPRLLCAALLGVATLVASACTGAGGSASSGGESTALYSLSEARAAQAAADGAQEAVLAQSQLTEATLNLALATAALVEALASEDPDTIAEASMALRIARQGAQRIATRVGADITAGVVGDGSGSVDVASGPDTPGAGIEVRMARANWDSGYLQAAILRALLSELGYVVSDPAADETTPQEVYPRIARGELDFWAHGWFPSHDQYLFAEDLAAELPDGGVIGDYASVVGKVIPAGALQGVLVDKKSADEFGVTSMADIAANPGPWDRDGNGLADISGCDEGWACKAVIDTTITLNGWDGSVEQISGDWSDLWLQEVARFERGEPVMTYMWTPTAFIVTLTPGTNAYWLSFPEAMADQQQPASVPADQCPGQPCRMGFAPADISVVANNAFLRANPAAANLFESFTIDVLDVALQNVRYQGGENTEADIAAHAAEWIADNRLLVDQWLAAARAAA